MQNTVRGIPVRLILVAAMALTIGSTAGCGGGSSSSFAMPGGSGGSGGSSGSGGTQTIASAAPNVAAATVDCGPSSLCSSNNSQVNLLYVTVTVCNPANASQCQTFNHIQVDTQSYGLRLIADATDTSGNPLNTNLLPADQDSTGSNTYAECTVFADGYSWGPLAMATVKVSGEATTAANGVPVQIIGQTNYSNVPTSCTSTGGSAENTVALFGANGVLGVGVFVQDCGSGCAPGGGYSPTYYYTCSAPTTCIDSTVPLANQVSNPVSYFQTDNNGVIVELPPIPASGAATVTGALVFGIGTQSNNGISGQQVVLFADPTYATITTTYNGQTLSGSIIDSGSNGYFFADSNITQCTTAKGFYCPPSTLNLSATNSSAGGSTGTVSKVNFSVANAENLTASNTAFDNLAGPVSTGLQSSNGVFDWGLPFFFGRNVYAAIDGANTSAGQGPYFAY